MDLVLGFLLAAFSLLAVSLQRTYYSVPAKELRRRARAGDELATALYKAVAYGYSLRFVLWFLIGLTSAVFFVFVSRTAPWWFALAASGALVWLGFVWLPANRITVVGQKLASALSPALSRLLHYIHRPLDKILSFVHNHRPLDVSTGLYEKADLLDLIDRQEDQADNRIQRTELEIVRSVLTFGDKMVRDVMTPRRVVKTVSAEEDLGPVLMTELHASGYSRFPVYSGKEDNFIGTLYLRDLVNARGSGKVKGKMEKAVLYLHEDQSLNDALRAILKTRHHLYVVVNTFEEYVGIITMEDVLEQIIGEQIMDEFDQYEDMRAVAKVTAKKDHEEHAERHEAAEKKAETKLPEPDGQIEAKVE